MLNRIAITTLAYFALQLTTLPVLSDVYRWVDDEGGVHYSDRKPQGVASTLIKISKVSNPSFSEEDGLTEQIDSLQEKEEVEKLKAQQQQEIALSDKATKDYCTSLKANIDTLTTGVRVKIKGEDGELRFLTAEEMVQKRRSSEQLFSENCGNVQP